MKIIIEGTPKEIAEFALALQNQPEEKRIIKPNGIPSGVSSGRALEG